jgi:hypothetical protein
MYVIVKYDWDISPYWEELEEGDWLIDWLFTVLRPAQEYFTNMETKG